MPHGLTVDHVKTNETRWLGSVFSNYKIESGDKFTRQPQGGYGDPLERKPELVLEDVIDDYVSIERAEKDYGVVIRALDPDILDYEIDFEATKKSVLHQKQS